MCTCKRLLIVIVDRVYFFGISVGLPPYLLVVDSVLLFTGGGSVALYCVSSLAAVSALLKASKHYDLGLVSTLQPFVSDC